MAHSEGHDFSAPSEKHVFSALVSQAGMMRMTLHDRGLCAMHIQVYDLI